MPGRVLWALLGVQTPCPGGCLCFPTQPSTAGRERTLCPSEPSQPRSGHLPCLEASGQDLAGVCMPMVWESKRGALQG